MENTREILSNIIRELAGIEVEGGEQELNLSSFDTLKIVIRIEQELGICIDDGKIFRGIFNNMNALEGYISTLI